MNQLRWRQLAAPAGISKGAAAGFLGGLAGSWAMNEFQALIAKWSSGSDHAEPKTGQEEQSEASEPATAQVATAISRRVLHHELTDSEKKVAEPAVHYTYGALTGAAYGAAAEAAPAVTAGFGLPFAAVLWMFGDEIAVPALGLSKPPWAYPASSHAKALASHLVYGAVTEGVRRVIRHVM